jgi:hypothetical protein
MSDPYSNEALFSIRPTSAPAGKRSVPDQDPYALHAIFPPPPPEPPAPYPVYRGSILPVTKYSDQSVKFEPLTSGLTGGLYQGLKQATDYAHKVYSGQASSDVRQPGVMGEILNAATFGLGANPFVRSGDRAIAGAKGVAKDLSVARTPTSEELKRVGGEQLNAVREMPVRYNPQSLGDLANVIEQDLIKKGIFPENSKQLYATLGRMRAAPDGAILEPGNLMALRQNMATLFTRPKEHQAGVGTAFEHLNNFIENPTAGAVLAGPAAEVGAAYAKGRANYAAGLRGEELADIGRTADLSRSAANSGQNLDNSLRQRVKSLVLNDKAMRGFTTAEEQALEAVPTGTPIRNMLRAGGNVLGGGGGLGASTTAAIAGGTAHFLGAGEGGALAIGGAAPIVGGLLKGQAARGTRGALDAIEQSTRQRSPLFLEQLPGQDLVPANPMRDAIARRLLQMETTPADLPTPVDDQQQLPPRAPLQITIGHRPYDPELDL